MDAFGVLYPQYWLQPKFKARFVTHLASFKYAFCQPKKLGLDELWVLRVFSTVVFDLQRSLFVITMKNSSKLAM